MLDHRDGSEEKKKEPEDCKEARREFKELLSMDTLSHAKGRKTIMMRMQGCDALLSQA
jgi:hypothetical protein